MKKILLLLSILLLPMVLADNEYGKVTSGGMLLITDVDVKVDGLSSRNLEYNEEIGREAKPNSKIELIIELLNNHSNLDMEKIEIVAGIEDLDLEDSKDKDKLNEKEDSKFTLSFTLPSDTEEDTYEIFIEAEGEQNNTIHKIEYRIDLVVEKADVEEETSSDNPSILDSIKILNESIKDMKDYYEPYTVCKSDLSSCQEKINTKDVELKSLSDFQSKYQTCDSLNLQRDAEIRKLEKDYGNCLINISQQELKVKKNIDNRNYLLIGLILLGISGYIWWTKYRRPEGPAQSEAK